MLASGKKRIKTKKAQPHSEEQYRLMFKSNPHPMWVYDLETLSFLAVNDAAVHHYGYSRDEFLGMTIKDIRPPEDIPALLDNVSRVTEGLDAAGVWRHIKKDGSIIFVEITSHTMIFEGRRAEVVLANDITEQIRVEEELRQSEERFRLAFDNAPIGMALVGLNEEFLLVNKALCNILGYAPEKLLATTISAITHPDDIEIEGSYKREMLDGEIQNFQIEKRYIHADGHIVWGRLSVSLVSDNKGKPFYYIGQMEDVTEHRRAEARLKQSEEKYRDLFENANDSICILDSELNFMDVNKKTLELAGYSRDEFLKMSIWDIIPSEQFQKSEREFEKLRKLGSYDKFVGKIRRKDGSFVDVEVSSSAIMDGDKVTGSRDIVRDISERRRAEEALRESEARFRSTFEQAAIGMARVDARGRPIESNAALLRMLGFSADELRSMVFTEFTHPDDAALDMDLFRELMAGKKDDYQIKKRFIRKNGSIFWGRLTVSLVRDTRGKPSFAIGMVEDITERKKAEDELQKSEEKYHSLVDKIQDGVFIFQDARIQFANEAFARMAGYTVEEIIEMDLSELVAPEDYAVVADRYRRRIAGENVPGEYQLCAIHKDGKTRITVIMNVGLIIYRGRLATMGTVKDITERRRAEEKLQLFRSLIDQSNDAIFVNDPETGCVLDVNDKACSNLGYSREELLKMRVFDIEAVIPDHFSWEEHVKEVGEKGYVILEGLHRRKDGTTYPAEINVKLIVHGKKSYMVAVARDLTDRKRAEEDLRIKAQLLDKATDSIFVFDLKGNFTYMNDAAYKSRGYTKEEMMKMNLHDIAVPEYSRLIDHGIKEMMEKGDRVFESAHFHKNGSILPVEVHARVIESGGMKLILGVTRDITERKRTEKLLHDNARAEFYGFIVSALPVFASNVPSSVRTTLVSNFAERFEMNMRPRFEAELKRLGHSREQVPIRKETLDVLMFWLLGLFSNLGIDAKVASLGRSIEFSNCPWTGEARGNPIYCFICRSIVIRSFMWTSLKGNAEQSSSIANGAKTCRFEIHVKP